MISDTDRRLDETETTLATKPDYQVWWHAIAAWLAGLALWVVGRDFSRFWTTLGDTIYAPAGHEPDLETVYDYAVVCHELAHRYDDIAQGSWYRISYLLSSRHRARWEVRGYGMQMVAAYRRLGRVPTQWPEQFAENITGPAYLWAGDREKVLASLEAIADALESGELDPDTHQPDALEDYISV